MAIKTERDSVSNQLMRAMSITHEAVQLQAQRHNAAVCVTLTVYMFTIVVSFWLFSLIIWWALSAIS